MTRYVLLGLLLLAPSVGAQEVRAPTAGGITGTVMDSLAKSPLAGAQVRVEATNQLAVTREDGRFLLANVKPGRQSLIVRRLGYAEVRRTVDVIAGAAVDVTIQLSPAALRLADVVVTGVVDPTSGTRIPFTVAKLDSSQLAAVPGTNAIGQLQGKVAGANVVTSGAPGAGVSVQLRTPTSINKTNLPLFVFDGVILSQTSPSTADLQSLDLESIEVVKGAAGASLYGSRAANGVINLRSKRGSSLPPGQTEFTLRTEYGMNDLPRDVPYAQYHAYRLNAAGQYVDTMGAVVTRTARVERADSVRFQDQPYPDATYNQIDRFFDRTPFGLTSLAVARNSDATSIRASFSNNIASGVVPMDGGFKRNDFRVNLDQRLRPDLQLGISAYHARSRRSLVDEGENSAFFDLINQAPDVNLLLRDDDGTRYIFQPDSVSQGARPNPLYTLAVRDWTMDRIRTLASSDLRWTPRDWLSFDGNLSYDRGDGITKFYFPRGAKTAIQSLQSGAVRRAEDGITALNASLTSTVLQRFGQLTARTSARVLMEREDQESFEANAQNLSVIGVPVLESGLATTGRSASTSIRANGYFLTTAVDYAERYIVDLLLRRDGSSLFGPEERWQGYYRASGAWRVAEEEWWPFARIGEFKLRFSRGTAGGRPSFADQFETYDIGVGGVLTKSTLGNPDLKPERSTETEYGLDAIVWNRFSVQLTHADNQVVDQLIQVPLPASAGYLTQWQNAGTVKGNTNEVTIEARVIQNRPVTWTTGLIGDRTRNRVTQFDRACFRTNTIGFRCAGATLGSMWGATFVKDPTQLPAVHAQSADQFQRNDDGLLVPVGTGGSWRDAKWGKTVTIDGINYAWGQPITLKNAAGADSIVQIGDGNPDYRVGWSNTLQWRGLSVYGLIDAQVGGNTYNRTRQRMYQFNRSADVDQVGKEDAAKKPTQYYQTLYNANSVVDWFVEDAGFVKLRELSVRYQLPASLLRPFGQTGVRNASIAVIGRNLFTKTNYKGYDPEVGVARSRLDDFIYPSFRTITGSVQVTF